MTTTVTGLFNTPEDASDAVAELKARGVASQEISIVTNKVEGQADQLDATDRTVDNSMAGTGATDGALIGGVVGGGAGLLAGLGTIIIPGIGPLLGVGWLVSTAIGTALGASGGGLVGALVGAGVSKEDATVYVDRIRGGGTLVSVRVADDEVSTIEHIMSKYKGLDHDHKNTPFNSVVETKTTKVSSTNTTSPAE
ncbi:MAG: general stress protein [Micropepsaceae bacterium]